MNCYGTGTETVLLGSVIKMAINFAYKGTTLTIDDLPSASFTYFSPVSKLKGITFTKDDLIRRETSVGQSSTVEWFAIVDTALIGKGKMRVKVEAMIPDGDVPIEGERLEIEESDTNVTIV